MRHLVLQRVELLLEGIAEVVEERAHELRRRALQPRRALGAALIARECLEHVLGLRLVGSQIERGAQRLCRRKQAWCGHLAGQH